MDSDALHLMAQRDDVLDVIREIARHPEKALEIALMEVGHEKEFMSTMTDEIFATSGKHYVTCDCSFCEVVKPLVDKELTIYDVTNMVMAAVEWTSPYSVFGKGSILYKWSRIYSKKEETSDE